MTTRESAVSLFFDADDNTITENTIAEGAGGIEVTGPGSGNTIADNTIGRTQFFGVLVESADFAPGTPTGNRIARNTIGPAGDGGIILFENERTEVARNTVTGAGTNGAADQPGWGIILDGVSHSLVDRNVVTGGRGRAISVGAAADENPSVLAPTGNVVSRNVAQSTGDDGIRVLAVARDTTVERNTASDNGADGIHVLSASTTLTRNTADRNAGLGIDAVAGVVDGGRNAAGANGNAAQCVGVVCAPDV